MAGIIIQKKQSFPIASIILTILVLVVSLYNFGEPSENIRDLIIFMGRFHPLVVHLPIGLIIGVLILQIAVVFTKTDMKAGIKIVLWFTMVSSILSVFVGTLLAMQGGYSEELLDKHRYLGLATSVAFIWLYEAYRSECRAMNLVFTTILISSMGLVGGTGHLGGALTHGEDYLTAYLPPALGGAHKVALMPAGTKEDAAIFGRVIQPVLQNKCVACHSESKSNGDLRMDTLEALHKGGKTGSALIVKNPSESLMLKRVHLPLEHKEHMPPKGKLQLNEAEIDLITWWIDQGATERMSLVEALPSDLAVDLVEKGLGFEVAESKLEMFSWKKTVDLAKDLTENPNIRIRRIALDSPALSVYFSPTKNNIDELFASLDPIKNNITQLDLGRTTFTEATAKRIGEYTNLQTLDLNNTPLDDTGVAHFQKLRDLKKLNLFGTKLTNRTLESLKKLPKLSQVITWGTDISYAVAQKFIDEKTDKTKQNKIKGEIKRLKAELNELEVKVIGPVYDR